ncbi:MAG: tRNA pseudouridine(55) synthase TruB [Anaerolineae bacterium]|jgi:tRNA pseudouridine55 synthase|nr:tRNA pseudouridine(55) synthase TruB [Anaerolineae bacterium]
MTALNGFLNVWKPVGMTSHDVVAKLRARLKQRGQDSKIGHAGTLDPLAEGVLVICLGPATRLSEYIMDTTKHYRAVVHAGLTTTTYDAEGAVLLTRPAEHLTRDQVLAALPAFTGDLRQIPPMYSAIKQGGQKLYDLARAGHTVERAPRPITIHALTLTDWSPPQFTLEVVCSAGTYIRSLAYDLGEVLGTGAHLAALTRTASGSFHLAQALPLADLLALPDLAQHLVTARVALAQQPAVQLTPDQVAELRYGRSIHLEQADQGALLFGFAGAELAAILTPRAGRWQPHKVFV